MKKPLFKATALSVALGIIAPVTFAAPVSNADVAKQLEALSKRVQELEQQLAEKSANGKVAEKNSAATIDRETDQRIRVLDRKLEIAEEETKALKTAAAKTQADIDKKAKALTLYGKINVAFEDRDLEGAENIVAGNAQGLPNHRRGFESYASRLGVKGELDLATGDLKAIYQAEYELNVDDGANGDTAFSQRNTFAGLKSATWGQIIGGKIDTPFKSAEGKFDQFNDTRADIDNLIGGQNRVSNIAILSSPKLFDAVTVNVGLIQNEGAGDIDYDGHVDHGIGDGYSTSIIYEQDIFYAALAYDKNVLARRSVDETVPVVLATAPTGYAKAYTDAWRFVGGIKSGIWEGGVLLQKSKDQRHEAANGVGQREDEAYLLSGAVTVFEKIKLKGQYGVSEGEYTDETGKLWALGADYNFTPRTKVYTYYSTLDLDKANAQDKTLALGLDLSF
jgi:predicted porin